MARQGRLLFLRLALLGWIRGHAGRRRAGVEDRPAEIAGQRRAQLGRSVRQARIVLRQIGEPIRRVPVIGAVEFGAGRACAAAGARGRERRRCPTAATAPRPMSTRRDSRVTGDRRDRRRISCGGRSPLAGGGASSRGASVTAAASRRCGRSAPSSDARRRA